VIVLCGEIGKAEGTSYRTSSGVMTRPRFVEAEDPDDGRDAREGAHDDGAAGMADLSDHELSRSCIGLHSPK
jgi:hypothetical protein